jgi:hypothetical protein
MSWAQRIATSLDFSRTPLREQHVDGVSRAPYRGAAMPYRTTLDTRSYLTTLAPALVGLALVLGVRVWHLSAMVALPAAVLSLALATTTRRGVAWSALSITALCAMLQAPSAQSSLTHTVRDLAAWPWLAMLSFVAFLAALEARRFLATRSHATTFQTSN